MRENALHKALRKRRVNRATPRKKFFRTTVEEFVALVKEHHGEVAYVADPESSEYRQSLATSGADAEFNEEVYDRAGGDEGLTPAADE
ncbi:MAG: hypothetical protein AVDCRST_MAG64-4170 [uncultured Phycisphaerae bacterium]|uniref:Uncharacterized protein n=1 Tax=uncultured Phycisphaerae bacterium TaxID=904963 RepID=A0A6J4QCQ5_9BACT|nr:MAG: hypothetical protein AVDCRST_MAG64-4170 [uncultured Phycisphaerae bacterium]